MAEWASAQRRASAGHSEETTGGQISEEAELQLEVGGGGLDVVKTAPTESKTSSRLESIENETRPSETAAAEMLFFYNCVKALFVEL